MDYSHFRKKLGERIRILRKEREIKQEKLAELVDKSTEHISFIERGERSPSLELLIDIAYALKIPVFHLLDIEEGQGSETVAIPAPIPSSPIPNTIEDPIKPEQQRQTDLERLQEGLENIKSLQALANEYDIPDVFQDNGGKVLQLLILLGLKQSKGREGNDAIDEEGREYELKTINLSLNPRAGITTHHHLTKEIIAKYKKVIWYIGTYEGIELIEIWKVHPSQLEELFISWEKWIDDHNGQPRNNPKIPLRYVKKGERVYKNPNKLASLQPTLLDIE